MVSAVHRGELASPETGHSGTASGSVSTVAALSIDMFTEQIKSVAFQRAALKSEAYRIVGLLCLMGALLLWTILRSLAIGHVRLLVAQTVLTIAAIAYEGLMLRTVRRALSGEGRISFLWGVISAFVEAQIPTLTIFLLIRSEILSPYQALVAPAMLAYFLFIILSTLRL